MGSKWGSKWAMLLVVAALSGAVQAAVPAKTCKANANWPGWSSIKHAFIFGDSYTSTSFNETGIQPTPTNPLGNPPYPGWTSANGPNWVDFLTVKHNKSVVLTYNIAYGGATINSALVAPYLPTVSSVADQIQNQWFPTYASKPSFAPWTSKDTLFAIFDGINDVGNSWWKGVEETTKLYANIFAVYHGLVDQLYYAGARNFAFVNVPPVDRAPLSLELTPEYQAIEKAAILAWNVLLADMAAQLKKTFPDVNVFTVDSWTLFTQVLDDPKSYPQTSGYKNVTAFCEAYKNGTPNPSYFDATCGVPVDQYLWLNSLHPTYPIHDVLAQKVAERLVTGPNVC